MKRAWGAETIDKLNSIKINSIYTTVAGEFDLKQFQKSQIDLRSRPQMKQER